MNYTTFVVPPRNPNPIARSPCHTIHTAGVGALEALVSAVLFARDDAQVFEPIIEPVAVDVVDVSAGKVKAMYNKHCAMYKNTAAMHFDLPIKLSTFCGPIHSGDLAGPPLIPLFRVFRRRMCFWRSPLPADLTGRGVIIQKGVKKVFRGVIAHISNIVQPLDLIKDFAK